MIKLKTFAIGGIHPDKHKITTDSPIIDAGLPETVYIPVKQHIGSPAKIMVKKGDRVKVGTLLADADGIVSSDVHSSVSGEVLKVEAVEGEFGYLEDMITIKVEGDEFEESINRSTEINREIPFSPEEIVAKIREAGIVGMGGAGYPTPIKTKLPEGKKVDCLIINGIECEPFLTADDRLMIEKAEQIVIGAKIINKALGIQNAIIAIMAQMGSFVPCASAHIGVIDKIFSRVGASDDLARGRSTFMVEMVETASILNQADERSFVILDEIGRGTATFDGLSIAWAVVEHLHELNKCRALFATHYHELTALTSKLPLMTLHCMKIKEFNDEVIFLHEVIDGAADRSYGIHVAKLAGLPRTVVKRAEQVLETLEREGKSQSVSQLAEDLPLFAAVRSKDEPAAQQIVPAMEALKELNPDNLTPREALDKLYELKNLAEESLKDAV